MDALAIAKHCEGKMLPVEATEVIFLKKIKLRTDMHRPTLLFAGTLRLLSGD